MEITVHKTKLALVQGDITKQSTDAIVNAANSGLMGGGGVDGAIHRAGGPAILEECRKIRSEKGRLPVGKAVMTTGGELTARYVIHTAGPVWRGGKEGEAELLASAYSESLKLAVERLLKSISFPSISTGAYGYPVELAAGVALQTIIDFLREDDTLDEVLFVLFDSATFHAYAETLRVLSKSIT
ncbi:MAG: O-acetyl-ADP-ribose deacetylase [Chloroflexota bacterium]|nr:O-acetyl-ADP-ribose deacetylase [Chloroflexota bacterium]